jgi:hypothetical protein
LQKCFLRGADTNHISAYAIDGSIEIIQTDMNSV